MIRYSQIQKNCSICLLSDFLHLIDVIKISLIDEEYNKLMFDKSNPSFWVDLSPVEPKVKELEAEAETLKLEATKKSKLLTWKEETDEVTIIKRKEILINPRRVFKSIPDGERFFIRWLELDTTIYKYKGNIY